MQEGGRRQRASQARAKPSENVLAALAGGLSSVIYHFVHFPSHLCTAGSKGSACALPARAKPVPWLCSVLAVHSRLLSPPALPGAAQEPKLGVAVYSQGKEGSISHLHQWQRAHLSLLGTGKGAAHGCSCCSQAASAGELQCLPLGSKTFSFSYFQDCAFVLITSKSVDVKPVNL